MQVLSHDKGGWRGEERRGEGKRGGWDGCNSVCTFFPLPRDLLLPFVGAVLKKQVTRGNPDDASICDSFTIILLQVDR